MVGWMIINLDPCTPSLDPSTSAIVIVFKPPKAEFFQLEIEHLKSTCTFQIDPVHWGFRVILESIAAQ